MHPILFKLGPITIYSYGVMVATAFSVCAYLMWRNAHLVGIPKDKVLDLVVVILISGIIGARFLHVILNINYYRNYPLEIAMLWRGGLAFYGGMIFSFIGTLIFLKKNNITIWTAGDLISPYAALGQSIGRIGCFLNGCCFGKDSHPTQIYASFILLFLYMALRFMLEKNIFRNNLILIYFMAYSFQRFFVEFLRGDVSPILFGLTVFQVLSIVIFIAAAVVFRTRRPKLYEKI